MVRRPNTWMQVKFGEVVRLVKEVCRDPVTAGVERVIGLEHIEPGDLRVRSWNDVADGTTFTTRVRPGQVLFGKRRAYQRKLALADFDAICSGDIYVFESANPERLLPDLLPFVCQTDAFFEHAVGTSAGSLSPRTSWSRLAQYELALPPLEEQRRFLEVLAAAETQLQALSTARQPLSDVTRRLLEAFKLSSMPWVPVPQLIVDGPRNGISPQCNDERRGRPTLPVGCVYTGVVNTKSDLKYAEIDDEMFERFRLRRDDVLVVRGNGNRDLVGRAGIVADEVSDCFYPDLLIRLRFDPTKVSPMLAVHLWNCVPIHASLIGRAKSTNGIYKVNGADLRAHRLPLPPVHVQRAMLEAVSAHAESVRSLDARIEAARAIKRNLLGRLIGAKTT